MDMRDKVLSRTRVPREYWPPADAWPSIRTTGFVDWTETFNLAPYLIDRNVEKGRGEQPALCFKDRSLSYNELSRSSNRLGSGLKKLGIRSGDRVAIRMTNCPEFVITDMALQKIGAIAVPLFVLLRAPSIAHILSDARITALIADAGLMEELEKAGLESIDHVVVFGSNNTDWPKKYCAWEGLVEQGDEKLQIESIYHHDVAMIHYTSGTTGAAKGCIQTPVGILGHVAGTVHRAGLSEGDVLAISPPLPFAYGHAAVMYAFYLGGSAILVERFSVEEYLAQAERYRATVLVGVPTLYRMMLQEMHRHDLSAVRLVMTAGETFTPELEQALREALPQANFFNFYGYTEMWNFIGTIPGVHPPSSLGIPYDEYEVRIVSEETGEPVRQGEVGMIKASGAAGALYWGLPERQRAMVKDNMFYSGDLAYQDEAGVIWFKARDVDIIKTSGYLVAPYEIEDALSRHKAVAAVGCIGVPDPVKGEIVKAFVKLRSDFEPSQALVDELEAWADEKLEKYKVPRAWEFIDEMPVTASGKTLRRGLKEIEMRRK